MAAVGFFVIRPDWFVIEIDGAIFRRVEPGQQLYKCCFAASITTDDEHHFTRFKRQIEWPEDKIACFTVTTISVSNGAKPQLYPCVCLEVFFFGLFRILTGESESQLVYLVQRDIGACQLRKTVHDDLQRSHKVKQR